MATNTYVALDTRTVSADVASVDFTNISGAYTDIVVVANVRGATHLYARVGNGTLDTANYYVTSMYGRNVSGSSQSGSERYSSQAYLRMTPFTYVPSATSTLGTVVMNFQNYANTNVAKQILVRSAGVGASNYGGTEATVLLWNSTSAINTLSFYIQSGNILAGSTFTIYGIAAASVGAKATGGTIYQDADYYYHVFAGSGTFTPSQSISTDVLVVAGGGGGSSAAGGGGGAGGLLVQSGRSCSSGTAYTVTIGAGGTASPSDGQNGGTGGNSVFDTITANGGGGGTHNTTGGSGGSGGGGGYGVTSGGSATQSSSGGATGYGYAGGGNSTAGGLPYSAGGGGGAGAIGGTGNSSQGGDGGIGRTEDFFNAIGLATGTGETVSGSTYFAGGGGGSRDTSGMGLGGYGGGGRGGSVINAGLPALAGKANTGGGGGGGTKDGYYNGPNNNAGVAGGSGIVIVRYAK